MKKSFSKRKLLALIMAVALIAGLAIPAMAAAEFVPAENAVISVGGVGFHCDHGGPSHKNVKVYGNDAYNDGAQYGKSGSTGIDLWLVPIAQDGGGFKWVIQEGQGTFKCSVCGNDQWYSFSNEDQIFDGKVVQLYADNATTPAATITIEKVWKIGDDVVDNTEDDVTFTNGYELGDQDVAAGGNVEFSEIPVDGWELIDITVNGNSVFENGVDFNVESAKQYTIVFTNFQEPPPVLGSATFNKVKSTEAPVAAGEFTFKLFLIIYGEEENSYIYKGKFATDENGVVTATGLVPGDYVFVEVETNDWELANYTEGLYFTILTDGSPEYAFDELDYPDNDIPTVINTPPEIWKGEASIQKVIPNIEDSEGEPVAAGEGQFSFKLFKLNDETGEYDIQIGMTYDTDEDGIVKASGLVAGSYVFIEVADENWALANYTNGVFFTLDEENGAVFEGLDNGVIPTVINVPVIEWTGEASILKAKLVEEEENENGFVYAGEGEFSFNLFKYNDETEDFDILIGTYSTDESGKITVDGLYDGRYVFIEVADENWILDNYKNGVFFTLDEENGTVYNFDELDNGDFPTVNNKPYEPPVPQFIIRKATNNGYSGTFRFAYEFAWAEDYEGTNTEEPIIVSFIGPASYTVSLPVDFTGVVTVSEINDYASYWTYDRTVYTLNFNGGEFESGTRQANANAQSEAIYLEEDATIIEVLFRNTYNEPGGGWTPITGTTTTTITPDPVIDLGEPEVPLIQLPNQQTPLAPEPDLELPDPEPPLATVLPATGQSTVYAMLFAIGSLIFLAGLYTKVYFTQKRVSKH